MNSVNIEYLILIEYQGLSDKNAKTLMERPDSKIGAYDSTVTFTNSCKLCLEKSNILSLEPEGST
jgi:hypothetical protein